MAAQSRHKGTSGPEKKAEAYRHKDAEVAARPDVGTQAQFQKRRSPATYRYDSSLSPALDWDGQNPAREVGEALIKAVMDAKSLEEAKSAAAKLKAISKPFLDWAGKAERLSFDVPTLPLFVHERLSTKAIVETLRSHRKNKDKLQQQTMYGFFGDPQRPVSDQVLKAYEYKDEWVNRMILGDSLVAMNSLVHYEGLSGQVQMIYMDPPYGVSYGSNFQPFIRKRSVKHNDDTDMTREPEMVQAYRDTWELGAHSYLTYLRDRFHLFRELLAPTGSVFVQISDENLHHVRELMDEVFGEENFMALISFRTKIPLGTKHLPGIADYLIWYAKSKDQVKYRRLFTDRKVGSGTQFTWVELPDGTRRRMTSDEAKDPSKLPNGSRPFRLTDLVSAGRTETCVFEFELDGSKYFPAGGKSWKTNREGIEALKKSNRLMATGKSPSYIFFKDDYPVQELDNLWSDTQGAAGKFYAVQTAEKVIQRCLLMTTDPGDLVLDPTCGGGTSACVAEQWGRRWVVIDTSRVPLALARQRLLTATFPWYRLAEEPRGPAGGFVFERKQDRRRQETGGIVPHITLGSITKDEALSEEILVDRPSEDRGITRVSGPFVVEATIPTPVDWKESADSDEQVHEDREPYGSYVDRMLEVLRKSPVLQVGEGKKATFKNVRPPAKTLSLSAEAEVANSKENPVAMVFGSENGAVSERQVWEAAREAQAKSFKHLYVIGFAIQPNARELIEKCENAIGVPATYVQATPDLMMGDLLKNMRSSQIFSVCGLPEVKIRKAKPKKDGTSRFQVELLGLDVFDPVEMKTDHKRGDDVPAWFLDTDYNGLSFHVSQAFFPRTSAWDALKKALKATHEESVWDHLAGTESAPFEAGDNREIAVKVIDDRGNELIVVKNLDEAV